MTILVIRGDGVQTYTQHPPLTTTRLSVDTQYTVTVRMRLVDLSYTFSETDRSIWPGNQPFRKSNCIMANVGAGLV